MCHKHNTVLLYPVSDASIGIGAQLVLLAACCQVNLDESGELLRCALQSESSYKNRSYIHGCL